MGHGVPERKDVPMGFLFDTSLVSDKQTGRKAMSQQPLRLRVLPLPQESISLPVF